MRLRLSTLKILCKKVFVLSQDIAFLLRLGMQFHVCHIIGFTEVEANIVT